jgi:hypothetical protein
MRHIHRRVTGLAAAALAILVGVVVAVAQGAVYLGWGSHMEWIINGTHHAAYDYLLNISHGCGTNQQMTVRVDLISYWNACWCVRDSESRTFRCRIAA